MRPAGSGLEAQDLPQGLVMSKRPQTSRRSWRTDLIATLLAVGVLFAARSSLADHYHVPSGSMQPTVEVGDRVLVSKAAYGLRVPFTGLEVVRRHEPARGDVVVLASPDDGATLLKRIVAVPGDRVEVRRGRLVLDGELVPVVGGAGELEELLGDRPHPLRIDRGGGPDLGTTVLGPDRYLVVGDNRGNSRDGRSFGSVRRSAIKGRVFGIYLRGGDLTWRGL